jgi:hypothetical protein
MRIKHMQTILVSRLRSSTNSLAVAPEPARLYPVGQSEWTYKDAEGCNNAELIRRNLPRLQLRTERCKNRVRREGPSSTESQKTSCRPRMGVLDMCAARSSNS